MHATPPSPGPRPRGLSLIAGLLLMLLVTLVALASMRNVTLQARMGAAGHDRNITLLAAENGLLEAANLAANAAGNIPPPPNCSNGYCSRPNAALPSRALDNAFAGWFPSTLPVSPGAQAAGLIVEDMGLGPNWYGCEQSLPPDPECLTPRFRLSSRSAAAGRAAVVLQAEWISP